jgi:hypothetical protein
LFPIPALEQLGAEDREILRDIDTAVDALNAESAGIADAGLSSAMPAEESRYQALRHPLSDHFSPSDGRFAECSRSQVEWRELRLHFDALSSAFVGDIDVFPKALCSLAAALTGSTELRTQLVRTTADPSGRFVQFPPAEIVEMRLAQLGMALRRNRGESPAFDAVIGLVCLTHCHPFPDGNGRTGRVLFNVLLQRRSRAPSLYLPLFELAKLSRGGYIVRVRQAELRGEWTPLFRFVLAAVQLWTEVLRDGKDVSS